MEDNGYNRKKLSGQLSWGSSQFELLSNIGNNKYEIIVLRGAVRLNHNSYNPDGHFYSLAPQNGQIAHRNLSTGTHIITVNVGSSYGKKDILTIVNLSFFGSAIIRYKILEYSNLMLKKF